MTTEAMRQALEDKAKTDELWRLGAISPAPAPEGAWMVEIAPEQIKTHDRTPYDLTATIEALGWLQYSMEASRDETHADWYIRVTHPDGGHLYNGLWRDSASKTHDEVIAEAIKGSCLNEVPDGARLRAAPGAGGARMLTKAERHSVYESAGSGDCTADLLQRKFCEVNGIQLAALPPAGEQL